MNPNIENMLNTMAFCQLHKEFGNKYGNKLMDASTKKGIDPAKSASKWLVQNTAEATGDLIGNKIADKITSLGRAKSKVKEHGTNIRQEIYIPPKRRQQVIDDLRLF